MYMCVYVCGRSCTGGRALDGWACWLLFFHGGAVVRDSGYRWVCAEDAG